MARSSMTSTLRIDGVSRLPSRCRSVSTFETTPEELIQHTPPSRSAAAVMSHPSSRPSPKPGRKLATASTRPGMRAGAQPAAQLVGGVLEAEREQQEQDADLGRERDEVLADVERGDAHPRRRRARPAGRAGWR